MTNFKINAANARVSILGFTEILRSKDQGYANPGEENNDLGIQYQNDEIVPPAPGDTLTDYENSNEAAPNTEMNETIGIGRGSTSSSLAYVPLQSAEPHNLTSYQGDNHHQPQTNVPNSDFSNGISQSGVENQSLEVWPPFFHPTVMDILSDTEMLNLSQVDMGSLGLDYLEPDSWFSFTN